MTYNFLFPGITHLPPTYDCIVAPPLGQLQSRLTGDGVIQLRYRVLGEGRDLDEKVHDIEIKNGSVLGGVLPAYHWRHPEALGEHSAYLEYDFQSKGPHGHFRTKQPLSFYSIYQRPGQKAIFADNAYKYGSPSIIGQIAAFGQYVETYVPGHVDRARDIGLTLAVINPYNRPVLARLESYDGRTLPRLKVPPKSIRRMALSDWLKPNETSWIGQVRFTASNRVPAYMLMHSLRDSTVLSDQEHLDPFRSDPTHLPAFRILRERVKLALRRTFR